MPVFAPHHLVMRLAVPILFAFLCLSPAAGMAQATDDTPGKTCPPAPDQSQRFAQLLGQVRVAPNETAARQITNQMWELWATAPDAKAQDMLDRGLQYRSQMDFGAAIRAFDALIAYCPDYAEGYNQRAFIRFIRRDYENALADLEATLARSPDHIAALSGKALTLFGLGRMEEGQKVLRRAVEMNPWLPERSMLTVPPGREL